MVKKEVRAQEVRISKMVYTLWFDGASRRNGRGKAGYGFVIQDPFGKDIVHASEFMGFGFTNNQAEYKALIAGLLKARALNIDDIDIMGDSKLVVEQVRGKYEAKNITLSRYLAQVWKLLKWFRSPKITYVPREENWLADSLAQAGADKTLDEYQYGQSVIAKYCCRYDDEGAWKYLLHQRIRGYWRMTFMLEFIQYNFPDMYENLLDRCYSLNLVETSSRDVAYQLAFY